MSMKTNGKGVKKMLAGGGRGVGVGVEKLHYAFCERDIVLLAFI